MRRITFGVLMLSVMLGTALASQCPALMAKIDDALKTAQLSEGDKSKVAQLRAEGEEHHKAGKHAESEAA